MEVLTLSALPPSREVLSSCRRTKTCPKKRPVEGHSCWLTPVAVVCRVPMKRVRLERPCQRRGEWQSRGRESTMDTTSLVGATRVRAFRQGLQESQVLPTSISDDPTVVVGAPFETQSRQAMTAGVFRPRLCSTRVGRCPLRFRLFPTFEPQISGPHSALGVAFTLRLPGIIW